MYIYSARTFDLIQSFPSAVKLSVYLNVSVRFGLQIVKLIQTSDYLAVIYKDYIISLTPHNTDFLSTKLK